jgi:Prokaryotic lipoprotein-attachment site
MICRHLLCHWRLSLDASSRWRKVGASSGLLIAVVLLSLALTGCGKRGPPEPPPGVPDTYPRPYPSE